MELYKLMKNIYGKNIEEELRKAILNVRAKLSNLTEERMCKVFSSYLLEELHKEHISARLINTLDIGLDYEHIFVLIPNNETGYFLADLTISQFNDKNESLSQLFEKGIKQ